MPDPPLILIVALAFAAGGVLKGATGYGAPLIAVPVMASEVNMAFAITVFAIPNLLPNLWQAWAYRADRLPARHLLTFAAGAAAGSILGAAALALVDQDLLALTLAAIVVVYVLMRLLSPDWRLSEAAGQRLAAPVGLLGGMFQTGAGLSAPVSLTYLSAMRLPRPRFVQTISTFFASVGLVQIPALVALGHLTPSTALLSAAALAPLALGMWIGTWVGRRISADTFQNIVLVVLALLALRLAWGALS